MELYFIRDCNKGQGIFPVLFTLLSFAPSMTDPSDRDGNGPD